jgi:hypothetical protein
VGVFMSLRCVVDWLQISLWTIIGMNMFNLAFKLENCILALGIFLLSPSTSTFSHPNLIAPAPPDISLHTFAQRSTPSPPSLAQVHFLPSAQSCTICFIALENLITTLVTS